MSSKSVKDLIEELSTPKNKDLLENIIKNLPVVSEELQELKELRDKGILQSLMGVAYLVASLKDVMSSEMISGTASVIDSLLELLSKISKPEFMNLINEIVDGLSSNDFGTDIKVKGALSLLKDIKDPDTARGFAMLLSIMKILGKFGKTDNQK